MECMQIYANSPSISFHSRFRLEHNRYTYFLAGSSTDLRFFRRDAATRRESLLSHTQAEADRSIDRSGAKKLRFFQLYSLLLNLKFFVHEEKKC